MVLKKLNVIYFFILKALKVALSNRIPCDIGTTYICAVSKTSPYMVAEHFKCSITEDFNLKF